LRKVTYELLRDHFLADYWQSRAVEMNEPGPTAADHAGRYHPRALKPQLRGTFVTFVRKRPRKPMKRRARAHAQPAIYASHLPICSGSSAHLATNLSPRRKQIEDANKLGARVEK